MFFSNIILFQKVNKLESKMTEKKLENMMRDEKVKKMLTWGKK